MGSNQWCDKYVYPLVCIAIHNNECWKYTDCEEKKCTGRSQSETSTDSKALKRWCTWKTFLLQNVKNYPLNSSYAFLQEFHAYFMYLKGIFPDKFGPWSVSRMKGPS